jgi:uncharacterized membrane protein YphA (DoxX/SURF4 family)
MQNPVLTPRSIQWFSRAVLALGYIWFGALKLLDVSPLEPLIATLHAQYFSFISFSVFYLGIAFLEVTIGILFLIPRFTKFTKVLFFAHILGAVSPILLLPYATWQSFLAPTLEGQYIIKDLILIALVLNLRSPQKKETRLNK